MRRVTTNLSLGSGLLCVPITAEILSAFRNLKPGIGIDVLLYEPFDNAFFLLGFVLFVAVNLLLSPRDHMNILVGGIVGALASFAWMFVSLLTVLQVHLSRGGQL